MKWLSDRALDRLRAAADAPDLSGTGYVLLDKLGAGGMGSVFRVEHTALGRQVALKVIGIVDSTGEFSARLLREARIIAQLEHPGIVPVHDVGTLPDGRVFYTMKLVQGRQLDQQRHELGGVPERLRTFQKICDAVSFAHAHNVLHRDLKPQNIMVGPFGEVLVMDWGLAKLLDADIPAQRREVLRGIHRVPIPRIPPTAWFSALPATWRRNRRAAKSWRWGRGPTSIRWVLCSDSCWTIPAGRPKPYPRLPAKPWRRMRNKDMDRWKNWATT